MVLMTNTNWDTNINNENLLQVILSTSRERTCLYLINHPDLPK